MDASIVVSLRIGSARNLRPAGNREVPRVGHGGIGHGPPGAGRCPWASCGLLVRCLGSAVPGAGYLAGSMSFPQGSLWRERPPRRRGVNGGPKGGPFTPPRCRTSGQKGGVAPSTSSPSGAAPRRAVRGGDTLAPRRTARYRSGFGKSVPTCVQCGFPGTTWTTKARTFAL